VAVILVIVFGWVSFNRLTPELFPDIELPYALVTTTYQGGTPEKVEKEVTRPIEQQLASLDKVKNIVSYSSENLSTVAIEFEADTNMDTVSMDMRDRIDLVAGRWDDSVGRPMILKLNPEMMPVMVTAVSKKGSDNVELSDFVEENVLKKLEGTEGVASVSATGLIDSYVKVTLDEKKIDKINKDVSSKILSQMSGATSAINQGASAINQGQSALNNGQKELKDAEKQLNDQISSAKKRLKQQRQQLVKLRDNSSSIKQNYDLIKSMEDANKAIEAQVRKDNPGKSDEEIQALLMANQTYVQNQTAITTAYSALKRAGIDKSELDSAVSELSDVNNMIDAIDDALDMLDNGNFDGLSQFGDSMAAAGSKYLQSTADQLTAQLAKIESEKQAALDSADLTGIITPAMVGQILQAQDFSMPAGYVDDGLDNKSNTKVLVSVGDKIGSVKELKNLILFDMDETGTDPVRLKDLATVERTNSSGEVYARINGRDGVLLSMARQSGYGTAEVAGNIRDRMDSLEKEYKGLKFSNLSDQGQYINIVIDNVLHNLLIGAILAILILLFFLRGIKPTLITALSIPISLTFAVTLMYFTGVTINVVSLAGLAVGIGMLVDNSIVVMENIFRLKAAGYSATKAAMVGASQVTGAITASTLTTISVFVPIIFVNGMTRQMFTDMALTVGYSLAASLIVALTLIPAMSRTILHNTKTKGFLSQDSSFI
ncbi:MAG: efflux RND transporter permease subunit, partial [Firmicutes bacterium]|nr:efflux RND transporter permease subunit [Bacillota bacterium]